MEFGDKEHLAYLREMQPKKVPHIDYSKIPATAEDFQGLIRQLKVFHGRAVEKLKRFPENSSYYKGELRAYTQSISWAQGIVRSLVRETEKEWKLMDWVNCEGCGGPVSVFTYSQSDDSFYDGELAKCDDCGLVGGVSVCDEVATVSWEEYDDQV